MRIGLLLLVFLISAPHFTTASPPVDVIKKVEKLMMAPGKATNQVAKTRALTKLVGQFKSLPVLAMDPEVKQTIANCVENGDAIEAYLILSDHFPELLEIVKGGDPVSFLIVSGVAHKLIRWEQLRGKKTMTSEEKDEWSELNAKLKTDIDAAEKIFFKIKDKKPEMLPVQSPNFLMDVGSYARLMKEVFPEIDPLVGYIEQLTGPSKKVQRHK